MRNADAYCMETLFGRGNEKPYHLSYADDQKVLL